MRVTSKNQPKSGQSVWIGVRYLLPVLALVITVAWLFIPCLRYTTAEAGTADAVSAAELFGNTWSQVRVYLFGGGNSDANTLLFCRTVLILLAVGLLLFAVGAVSVLWVAIGAFRFFSCPQERGTGRILYITLFPNRPAAVLWQSLTLPLLAFPRILVVCYEKILHVGVLLQVTFCEPLAAGCILFLLSVIVTAAFMPLEKRMQMDPFFTPKRSVRVMEREEEPQREETARETEEEKRYAEMCRRAKEEQMARIRAILHTDDTDDVDDPNEDEPSEK